MENNINSKAEELRKLAFKVSISETEKFLFDFNRKRNFKIRSPYPTINSIDCEIEKGDRCFRYNTDEMLPDSQTVSYQHKSYGFQDPFYLENEKEGFSIYNGASVISIHIADKFNSSGEIWEICSEHQKNKGYCRALLPIGKFHEKPLHFIESNSLKTDSWYRSAGYVPMSIGKIQIGFFDSKLCEVDYLVIEAYQPIEILEFERIVGCIIYSFGLVSGSLIRDEIYLITFEDADFTKIAACHYRRIEDSKNGLLAINPMLHKELDKSLKSFKFLEKKDFRKSSPAKL